MLWDERVDGPEFGGPAGKERIRLFLRFDKMDDSGLAVEGAVRAAPPGSPVRMLSGRLGCDCVVTVIETDDRGAQSSWTLRYRTPLMVGGIGVMASRLEGYYKRAGGPPLAVRLTTLHYLVVLPKRWVAIQAPDVPDVAGRGDVVFGDDVASRVIRSIRPAAPTP
jgi:hypothetical protein